MNKALQSGPWFINKYYLSIKRWQSNFVASEAMEICTSIWLRLPRLLMEYYDHKLLAKIGNRLGKYLESQIFKYKSKLASAASVTKLEEKSSNNNIIQTPLASKHSTSMTGNDHECNSHKDGGDDVMNDVIINKLANSNPKDTKAASKSSALNLTPTHKKPTLTSNYPLPPTFNKLNPMNYTPRETPTTYSENVNEKPFHPKSYTSTTSTNQMIFEHMDRSGNVHSNNCAPTGLPKIEEDNKDITRGKLSTVGAKK
ncbi:hypothetical protein MTR67_019300, partial [Solanum verrucosum]